VTWVHLELESWQHYDEPFIPDDVIQDALKEFGSEHGHKGDVASESKDDELEEEGEVEVDEYDRDFMEE